MLNSDETIVDNGLENLRFSLGVKGFKSIRDKIEISVRPLTVLLGDANSGKSSFMQPLLLMKQTLQAPYGPSVFLLDGRNVSFTLGEQLLWRDGGKKKTDMFMVEISGSPWLKIFYRKTDEGYEIPQMIYRDNEEDREHCFSQGMHHLDIMDEVPPSLKGIYKKLGRVEDSIVEWNVARNRCFLELQLIKPAELDAVVFGATPPARFLIRSIIHVPACRAMNARNFRKPEPGDDYPGLFQDYVPVLIHHWQKHDRKRLGELERNLESLGFTWKIRAKSIDDTRLEIYADRSAEARLSRVSCMLNIADMGTGLAETLPVLSALLAVKRGQILFLEHPEKGINPALTESLSRMIVEAAAGGAYVIVETRNEYLAESLRESFESRFNNLSAVSINRFKRNSEGAAVTE